MCERFHLVLRFGLFTGGGETGRELPSVGGSVARGIVLEGAMALEKVSLTGCSGEGASTSGFGYATARHDSASFSSGSSVSPPSKKVDAQFRGCSV